MPRTKQHSERGSAALQQRVESIEAEAAALRRQCKMLGMHVWLLQRELTQAERETSQASSRTKPTRRRTRQNTTEGLRASSSASGTPVMLRPSASSGALAASPEVRISSAASSESEISPKIMRRPVTMKTELKLTPSFGEPPPLVQLARNGGNGSGVKVPTPQRPQPLTATQNSRPSPSLGPSAGAAALVGSVGSELFDRPHSGEITSLSLGLSSGLSSSSSPGAAREGRPGRLVVGSLQEYVCPPLREAAACASHSAAELDAAFLTGPRLEHAWTPCPGRSFNVRQPNYARTALKLPSLEAMYEVVAQDTFACPEAKLPHMARLLDLPKEECLQRYGVPSNLVHIYIRN